MTVNHNDKSTSISMQVDSLIPMSRINNLIQDMFVGTASDNLDECIDRKIFHAEIVVDSAKVSVEMTQYRSIPEIDTSRNKDGSDSLKETAEISYQCVRQGTLNLVTSEIERIKHDSNLCCPIKTQEAIDFIPSIKLDKVIYGLVIWCKMVSTN